MTTRRAEPRPTREQVLRIRIERATHALEGPQTQSVEKKFDFVYDAAQRKWVFRL